MKEKQEALRKTWNIKATYKFTWNVRTWGNKGCENFKSQTVMLDRKKKIKFP